MCWNAPFDAVHAFGSRGDAGDGLGWVVQRSTWWEDAVDVESTDSWRR